MTVEICVIFNMFYIFVGVPFTIDGDTLSFREGCVVGPTAPTPGRLRLPACVLGRFWNVGHKPIYRGFIPTNSQLEQYIYIDFHMAQHRLSNLG